MSCHCLFYTCAIYRDNNEESPDERENREERDCRKLRLVDRVSDAFQKKWKPMNTETTAFSYWGFVDDNVLPYEEIWDDDDDNVDGTCGTKHAKDSSRSDCDEVEEKNKDNEQSSSGTSENRTDHDAFVDEDDPDADEGPCMSAEARLKATGTFSSKSRSDLNTCADEDHRPDTPHKVSKTGESSSKSRSDLDTFAAGDHRLHKPPHKVSKTGESCSKRRSDLDTCAAEDQESGPRASGEGRPQRTDEEQRSERTVTDTPHQTKRSSYLEYHHAIILAKGEVAYRVKP